MKIIYAFLFSLILSSKVLAAGCTPPIIISHPLDTVVCENGNISFSVFASGPSLVYQWQVDQGLGFTNLSNIAPYSGVSTSLLNITTTPFSLDNASYREQHGSIPPTSTIPTRDALAWVTIEGARMLKCLNRLGSLAPGKQADLVLIRTDSLNMQPIHDPINSVVMQTSLANIDSVMIAGQWKKRDGQLLGVDLSPKLARLRASGEKIRVALQ